MTTNTPAPADLVEAVAKALCHADGKSPDERQYFPKRMFVMRPLENWREYITPARAAVAAYQAHQTHAASDGLTPEQAWQELVEYDDRTSPEEYPEMALITREELASFMAAASCENFKDAYQIERADNEQMSALCHHKAEKLAERDAEIARLQTDAARYHWLRDNSCPPHNFYVSVPDEFHGVRYTPEEVDQYIDEARAALAEEGRA